MAAEANYDINADEQVAYRERNIKAYSMIKQYVFQSSNADIDAELMSIANNKNTSQKAKYEQFVALYKKHLIKRKHCNGIFR
jgi:hypothetical protein